MLGVFALTTTSFAQVEIQASDLNPILGETFTSYKTNAVSVGPTGNNVTWDLTQMVSTANQSSAIAAANTSFPLSNSTTNIDDLSKLYNLNNTSGQFMYGDLEGTTLITYTDPMQMMAFPITTTLTASDVHTATFSAMGFDFNRSGTTSISCNSWGTLITPEGSFTNVLRVRLQMDYVDTYVGGSFTYSVIAYAWYKAGIHKELASVVEITSPQGVSSYGQYLETSSLGIQEVEKNNFTVYPNPVNNELSVNIDNKQEIKTIEVLNLSGKIVKEFTLIQGNSMTLNVEDLMDGIYLLNVTTVNNESKVVKFIKE